ncbi:SHOCT domain-containing protein [Actinocorallia aurea]
MGAYWPLMWFSMLLVWVLITVGIIALVRYMARQTPAERGSGPAVPRRPQEILAERFARGEIDVEEYRDRMSALGP